MEAIKKVFVSELKKGDFFTLCPCECPDENKVYVRGDYDRSDKSYSCYKFNDVNCERFYKGKKAVYTGFAF